MMRCSGVGVSPAVKERSKAFNFKFFRCSASLSLFVRGTRGRVREMGGDAKLSFSGSATETSIVHCSTLP